MSISTRHEKVHLLLSSTLHLLPEFAPSNPLCFVPLPTIRCVRCILVWILVSIAISCYIALKSSVVDMPKRHASDPLISCLVLKSISIEMAREEHLLPLSQTTCFTFIGRY